MDDEKKVDLMEEPLGAQPKGVVTVADVDDSSGLASPMTPKYVRTNEQVEVVKAAATTEPIPVEAFKGSRRSFVEILQDVYETVAVLLSLQFIHVVVGAMSLPDEVKNVVNIIHIGGSLLVIALLTLGFAKRMAKRSVGIDINLSRKKSHTGEFREGRDGNE